MKLNLLFFGTCILFVLCSVTIVFTQNLEGFVVEGERFDGVIIGKSTMDDVFAIYGNDYNIIKHKEYSYEIIYKNLGLSFYSCQADPNKEIFSIDIQLPSKITTRKGIVLGESTFADVLRIFGKSESNYEYKGITFFNSENNFEDEIKEAEQEEFKSKTASIEKSYENPPKDLFINGQKFIIDGAEISDNRTGNINLSNSLNNEISELNVEIEENTEIENDKVEKNKIINRIQLFEKLDVPRQCHVKFRK